jgi:hypothetical protein
VVFILVQLWISLTLFTHRVDGELDVSLPVLELFTRIKYVCIRERAEDNKSSKQANTRRQRHTWRHDSLASINI